MNAIWKRFAFAWFLAALICGLFTRAALGIGVAAIEGGSPVTGTAGSAVDPKSFTLTLSGNSFETLPTSAEFASWMKNLPAGLKVTVANSPSLPAYSIRITIDGTPTQISSAPFQIVIPKGKLFDPLGEDLLVDAIGNACYDITPSANSVIAVALDGDDHTPYTPYTDFAVGWNVAVGGGNTPNTKVQLLQNWTAGASGLGTGTGFSNGGILVPSGKTVALNLCGRTVAANDNVTDRAVIVYGALTLSDSGGGATLTGAANGCLYVSDGGSLAMTGGSITGNSTAGNGGGVYANGSLQLSGQAKITGNTKGGNPSNVYLPNGKIITVTGAFTAGARIGVTTQTSPTRNVPIVVTGACATDCSASFASDAGYTVQDAQTHVVKLVNERRIDVAVSPSDQFPVGNAGGDLTVNVGHGIPSTELGAAHIAMVRLGNALLRIGTDCALSDGGSVLITLYRHYLNTLPVGTRTLSVTIGNGPFADATVQTDITVVPVVPVMQPPRTGDGAQPLLWLCLTLAAGAALGTSLVLRRIRRSR